ncbi:hypothetical protein ONZ51_g9502 [Trametes cubensis]|uniref:3-oxoacyl-[acyl-carrier-protein] reductase n=1 Tax=Trametes cubensis TaxID=1111947 RepID=A0AAD7TLA2_9APHY|nr:hypothetical protein ONZ51_g9502 [Trametes cubensis]
MADTPLPLPRVAIVTGAAQGIGEAIALRLAEDGLDVTIVDLPQKREQLETVAKTIRAKGRRSVALYGDVSLEDVVVEMIETTVKELGGLDVMVANAGICHFVPVIDTTVEQWESTIAVNARSVLLAIKYAARQMIAQGRGGRIIAASSVAGKQGHPGVGAYCASKFAVRGLVHTAAIELRAHNITVNGYCPGLIATPLVKLEQDEQNGGHGTTVRMVRCIDAKVHVHLIANW